MNHFKYLIIGNAAGGIGAMEAIRGIDKEGSMAVISDEPHHTYGRPMISYYLGKEVEFDKIFYRPSDFYEKKNIDVFLGKLVTKIDYDKSIVALDNGEEIGYDKLLLSTGGQPFVPRIDGLDDHEFFTFITLDSALKIDDKIANDNVKKAVVLGAGLVGLKATEALVERGVDVEVIELADRVLSPVLDEQASEIVRLAIEEKGVKFRFGRTISKIIGEGGKTESVILDDGKQINCDLLIVGIGVRPRIELAQDSPVEVGRGIIVNKNMETSVPGVYACGDCAEVYDFILDNFRLTPLWPTAHIGGRVAGSNMAGVEKEYVWGTGMNAVDFFGYPVMSAGLLNSPEGEEMEALIKLDPDTKTYKKFLIRDQRIKGMILLNEVDKAGVILALMRNETDITSFKDELLGADFGAIHLPRKMRDEINTLAN